MTHRCVIGLIGAAFVLGGVRAGSAAVFFSEYIEGTGSNKAIEIFNSGGSAVNIGGWVLQLYSNGAASPSASLTFAGGTTIAAGDVFVVANSGANAAILAVDDLTNNSVINWNGDDAIALKSGSGAGDPFVDIFGRIGQDPGTAWTGGGVSTLDKTLRRKASVAAGVTINPAAFDPSVEWTQLAVDTFDGFGYPGDQTSSSPPPVQPTGTSNLLITEVVDANLPGGLPKFVELTNVGATTLNMADFSLGIYNNGGSTLSAAAAVLAGSLAPGQSYIVAYESQPAPGDTSLFEDEYGFAPDHFVGPNINGDDVIALFLGAATGSGVNATLVDILGVVGIDGTGQPWEYTDGYARRLTSVVTSNPAFTGGEWGFGGPASLAGAHDAASRALLLALTDPGEFDNTPGFEPTPTGDDDGESPVYVPEPASALLMVIAGAALLRRRR